MESGLVVLVVVKYNVTKNGTGSVTRRDDD